MRRRLFVAGGVLTIALGGVLMAAEPPGAKIVDDGWVAAAKAGNVEAMVALYARDATFYPPNVTDEIKGTEAIRKYYADWFAAVTITDATIVSTYDSVGDLSVGYGMATVTYAPKAGGSPLVMSVRVTAAARRINGRWVYVVDHASVPAK